jgi:stearoyl-CoA desaturase (Delta-9 desaturase)
VVATAVDKKVITLVEMTPEQKRKNNRAIVSVIVHPPLGILLFGLFVWFGVGIMRWWFDIPLLFAFHLLVAPGVTVGLHRLFTHGSFKTTRWVKMILATQAMLAIEGYIMRWVADHLWHHDNSDTEDDLHSPMRSAWHAHAGWFLLGLHADQSIVPSRVREDPDLLFLDRHFPKFVLASFLMSIPVGLVFGYFVAGPEDNLLWSILWGGFEAFIWGGLIRIVLIHHVTWSVNSICHMIGSQDEDTGDNSRNVWWLAFLSLGESWHNFHHKRSGLACHGTAWWNDPSYAIILVLEWLGLAWEVKHPKKPNQLRNGAWITIQVITTILVLGAAAYYLFVK